jgi:hypothetical protein
VVTQLSARSGRGADAGNTEIFARRPGVDLTLIGVANVLPNPPIVSGSRGRDRVQAAGSCDEIGFVALDGGSASQRAAGGLLQNPDDQSAKFPQCFLLQGDEIR